MARSFSKQQSNMAYALIERLAPFPTDVLADNVPLQYKLSLAHARATSVHPSCAHAHLITLASSKLHALKMNYSDLLGVFPNLLMLITGACGDGKSIPLWLDTMIMHMYRKKEYQLTKQQYDADMLVYNQLLEQHENPPEAPAPRPPKPVEPKKPKEVDELYDAGSTVGLGQIPPRLRRPGHRSQSSPRSPRRWMNCTTPVVLSDWAK